MANETINTSDIITTQSSLNPDVDTSNPMVFIKKTIAGPVAIGSDTLKSFKEFLTKKDILDLAIGVTIGTYITAFSKNVIDIIGKPIIDRLLGNKKFADRYNLIILGMKFDLGRLFELILNLFVTLFIIFMIFKYIPKMISKDITK